MFVAYAWSQQQSEVQQFDHMDSAILWSKRFLDRFLLPGHGIQTVRLDQQRRVPAKYESVFLQIVCPLGNPIGVGAKIKLEDVVRG